MPDLIADNDITVTSATQSAAELAAHFGDKGAADTTPAADAPTDGAKDAKDDVAKSAPTAEETVLEAEADSGKPDTEISDAARTLRGNRADARKAKINGEIAALTKKRHDTQREVEDLERRREALRTPATPATAPVKGDEPTPRREAAAPEFKFPTWDEFQEQPGNDTKTHADYIDARTDARYAFNRQQDEDRVAHQRAQDARREQAVAFKSSEDAYRVEHPDYDDALAAVSITEAQLASPQWRDLKGLVAQQSGKVGPQVMHHLAKNPEDLNALLGSRNRIELFQEFGAIKRAAVKGTATAAAPVADGGTKPAADAAKPAAAASPSKPTSSAPAPVTPVNGGAAPGRSLTSLAEDSDDADAYIETRGMGRLLKR